MDEKIPVVTLTDTQLLGDNYSAEEGGTDPVCTYV